MLQRHKYDSFVIFLYSIGKEHILPLEFRRKIPYSTISGWRKADYSQYIGNEFRDYFEETLTNAELHYRYNALRKGMHTTARTWALLKPLLVPEIKKAGGDKLFQRRILKAIHYMQGYLGLARALKVLGISITLYRQWELEARFDCFDSYTSLCVKRHPHQLSNKEVAKIKKMLVAPEQDHWPVVSIAALAVRKKSLIASLSTVYKYARLFGIRKKLHKKDRKKIGIVSTRPNEYLHVDTTFYEIIEGRTVCISFVMDNYSKMILGFHVSERNNFKIVINSVRKALKVIATHPDQSGKHGKTFLVTDGGTENHNKKVDKFIAKWGRPAIKKIRALKDIRPSNSPVEAVHKIMKGRYLKKRKFTSIKQLVKYLDWAVMDYNELRPHYKHRPRTPYEVYFNIPLGFDVRERMRKGIKARVKNNKCTACIQCTAAEVLNNRKKPLKRTRERCEDCDEK